MASNMVEMGPKLDWTRDHLMYDRYKDWKLRVEMLMDSALEEESDKAKCNYLKFWLAEEGLPLIRKWENTKKLVYTGDSPSGHKLTTYWNLLDEEFKPKANRIISVIDLWTNSRQGQTPLSEWITKVYNQVELCHYKADSKDRIIRDVLIVGCNSTQAKDKIIRKGEDVDLKSVLDILQTEDTTSRTMQNLNSATTTTANVHYVKYDNKKKSGSKKVNSTNEKKCYRCGWAFIKDHNKNCPARDAECKFCGIKGHYAKCCGKAGKFPKEGHKNGNSAPQKDNSSEDKKSMHTLSIQEENSKLDYYDELGNLWTCAEKETAEEK